MRTRNVPTPGHSASSSARCAAYAAATAAAASPNTAMTASPPYFTTRPPAAATVSRRSASWVASASAITSGCASHSGVWLSMSVNRKVAVVRGVAPTAPARLMSEEATPDEPDLPA